MKKRFIASTVFLSLIPTVLAADEGLGGIIEYILDMVRPIITMTINIPTNVGPPLPLAFVVGVWMFFFAIFMALTKFLPFFNHRGQYNTRDSMFFGIGLSLAMLFVPGLLTIILNWVEDIGNLITSGLMIAVLLIVIATFVTGGWHGARGAMNAASAEADKFALQQRRGRKQLNEAARETRQATFKLEQEEKLNLGEQADMSAVAGELKSASAPGVAQVQRLRFIANAIGSIAGTRDSASNAEKKQMLSKQIAASLAGIAHEAKETKTLQEQLIRIDNMHHALSKTGRDAEAEIDILEKKAGKDPGIEARFKPNQAKLMNYLHQNDGSLARAQKHIETLKNEVNAIIAEDQKATSMLNEMIKDLESGNSRGINQALQKCNTVIAIKENIDNQFMDAVQVTNAINALETEATRISREIERTLKASGLGA